EALVVREREPRGPGDRRADVHRRWREAHGGERLRDEAAPDLLAPIATDVQRAPVELLDERQRRVQARGGEVRVDGVCLNDAGVARVIDIRVEAGPRGEALLVLPAEADRAGGRVELRVSLEREAPVDEPVEPLVARLGPVREVAAGVPVTGQQEVYVVVDDEIVAEVREVPLVAPNRSYDVVEAEPRHEDPAPPSLADVLEDEWQPHDRDITDVEHGRTGYHHVLVEPLHLTGPEVVIRDRIVIGCDLAVRAVQAGRTRVHGEIAPDEPIGGALLE